MASERRSSGAGDALQRFGVGRYIRRFQEQIGLGNGCDGCDQRGLSRVIEPGEFCLPAFADDDVLLVAGHSDLLEDPGVP